MLICRVIATGLVIGSQDNAEPGALIARAAVEFPEYPAAELEEVEVTAEEFTAIMAEQNRDSAEDQRLRSNAAVLSAAQRAERLDAALAQVESMDDGTQKDILSAIISELKGV